PDRYTAAVWPGWITRSRLSSKLSNSIAADVPFVTSSRIRPPAGASISAGAKPFSSTARGRVRSSAATAPEAATTITPSTITTPRSRVILKTVLNFTWAGVECQARKQRGTPGKRLASDLVDAALTARLAAFATLGADAVELHMVAAHDEAEEL